MSKVRVCFLGTPDFAVTCLKRIFEDEHYEIAGVITQPDRPAGRKMVLTPSAVKSFALKHGLTVISPESVNADPILQEVQGWNAEVGVVVAFGQIVSQKFLDLFRYGCVNVHGSILPRWRGAAPIQRALAFGDVESGVSLQKMVKALDAGDVLGIRKVTLDDSINASELYEQLAILGGDLLHVELMDYVRGNLVPKPQDSGLVTYAKKIEKSEALIQWTESAISIHNKVRAFAMGPGTFTNLSGKKLKIHKTKVFSLSANTLTPGTVVAIHPEFFTVATGDGTLSILEVQPESRNRQPVRDFLKSHILKAGDLIG